MSAHHEPDLVTAELSEYFPTAESTFGLSGSSLGGHIDADPERHVMRRHKLAIEGDSDIETARPIRAALLQLSAKHCTALFAAYGGVDWTHTIDSAFGRGMGARVIKKIGDLVGVALCTDSVAKGYARDGNPRPVESDEPVMSILKSSLDTFERGELVACRFHIVPGVKWSNKPRPWDTAGGWLVALCLRKSDLRQKHDPLKAVKDDATTLLNAARWAYADARGFPQATVEAEPQTRVRSSRPDVMPLETPRVA